MSRFRPCLSLSLVMARMESLEHVRKHPFLSFCCLRQIKVVCSGRIKKCPLLDPNKVKILLERRGKFNGNFLCKNEYECRLGFSFPKRKFTVKTAAIRASFQLYNLHNFLHVFWGDNFCPVEYFFSSLL